LTQYRITAVAARFTPTWKDAFLSVLAKAAGGTYSGAVIKRDNGSVAIVSGDNRDGAIELVYDPPDGVVHERVRTFLKTWLPEATWSTRSAPAAIWLPER
jgi:hypothetical protein